MLLLSGVVAELRTNESAPPARDPIAARALLWVSAGVLLFWGAHNGFVLPWEVRHLPAPVLEPALIALRALVWLVPAALYLRRHDPRPLLKALGVSSRVSTVDLGWSLLGGAAYLVALGGLLGLSSPSEGNVPIFDVLGRVDTVYLLLRVTLEELLLRGFLLGQLVRFTSALRAQVSVAVIFGLMHLPAWISLDGMGVGLIPSIVFVTVLGAVLGAVARASNSVIPAVALHFANNLLADWLGAG